MTQQLSKARQNLGASHKLCVNFRQPSILRQKGQPWLWRAGLAWAAAMALSACNSIDLQGHRGARGLLPENTLPAFARALDLGVTTLELDVGLTKDGVLVVAHDPTLNPNLTRNSAGQYLEKAGPALFSMTYGEVARFDVGRIKPGSRYAETFATQAPVDGTSMPRLSDVFALVKARADQRVRFNIETKLSPEKPGETASPEDFVRRLIEEIRTHGLASRAAIQSFDWRTLQIARQAAPEIALVYLSAQQTWLDTIQAAKDAPSPWTAGVQYAAHGSVPRMVAAAGSGHRDLTWSPYFGDLTPALLAQARTTDLKVVVWTVNKPEDIERMLDWGVDGIITDYPDRAVAILTRRGIRW